MNKNIQIIILSLLGIGIVVYGFILYKKNSSATPPAIITATTTAPIVKQVEQTKLPEKFPTDFPLERGVQVNTNYNTEVAGAYQATHQFVSEKTLAENYKLYNDYLKKNSWVIVAKFDEPDSKFIQATKEPKTSVTISMTKSLSSGKNIVDISFVYR